MNLPENWWKCPQCGAYNLPHHLSCSCGFIRASRQTDCSDGVSEEDKLHDEIIKLCQERRWAYIHPRMDKKSTIGRGCPDFVIFPPSPYVIVMECKSKTGKQTPEQLAWQCQIENCGHVYHLVRSMDEFMSILRDKGL